VVHAGADPGFSKGGAKLTKWRRMRHISSRTRNTMYGSILLHKFFIMPPIFPSQEQKKRSQPTATRIMDHHLTFLQLLELPYAPLPPSQLHEDYLNSLKNVTCQYLFQLAKLWTGVL